LSFVKDCPIDPEATQKLLEKIGPIRETHYGKGLMLPRDRTVADMNRWFLRLHIEHGK
jgi:hypothetical protein